MMLAFFAGNGHFCSQNHYIFFKNLNMLLDILMFNRLCCLFFQKFQGVREPIAYKALLIKHDKPIKFLGKMGKHLVKDFF